MSQKNPSSTTAESKTPSPTSSICRWSCTASPGWVPHPTHTQSVYPWPSNRVPARSAETSMNTAALISSGLPSGSSEIDPLQTAETASIVSTSLNCEPM